MIPLDPFKKAPAAVFNKLTKNHLETDSFFKRAVKNLNNNTIPVFCAAVVVIPCVVGAILAFTINWTTKPFVTIYQLTKRVSLQAEEKNPYALSQQEGNIKEKSYFPKFQDFDGPSEDNLRGSTPVLDLGNVREALSDTLEDKNFPVILQRSPDRTGPPPTKLDAWPALDAKNTNSLSLDFLRNEVTIPDTGVTFWGLYQQAGTEEGYKFFKKIGPTILPVLFPANKPSPLNEQAPVLSEEMLTAIQTDPNITARYLTLLSVYLQYCGLQLVTSDTGEISIEKHPNFEERAQKIWDSGVNKDLCFAQLLSSLHSCGFRHLSLQLAKILIKQSSAYNISAPDIRNLMNVLTDFTGATNTDITATRDPKTINDPQEIRDEIDRLSSPHASSKATWNEHTPTPATLPKDPPVQFLFESPRLSQKDARPVFKSQYIQAPRYLCPLEQEERLKPEHNRLRTFGEIFPSGMLHILTAPREDFETLTTPVSDFDRPPIENFPREALLPVIEDSNFPILLSRSTERTGNPPLTLEEWPACNEQRTNNFPLDFLQNKVTIPGTNITFWDLYKNTGTEQGNNCLETSPEIIPALFPAETPSSLNTQAPLLSKEMVQAVQTDPKISARYLALFVMQLQYWGLTIEKKEGKIYIKKQADFDARVENLQGDVIKSQVFEQVLSSLLDCGFPGLALQLATIALDNEMFDPGIIQQTLLTAEKKELEREENQPQAIRAFQKTFSSSDEELKNLVQYTEWQARLNALPSCSPDTEPNRPTILPTTGYTKLSDLSLWVNNEDSEDSEAGEWAADTWSKETVLALPTEQHPETPLDLVIETASEQETRPIFKSEHLQAPEYFLTPECIQAAKEKILKDQMKQFFAAQEQKEAAQKEAEKRPGLLNKLFRKKRPEHHPEIKHFIGKEQISNLSTKSEEPISGSVVDFSDLEEAFPPYIMEPNFPLIMARREKGSSEWIVPKKALTWPFLETNYTNDLSNEFLRNKTTLPETNLTFWQFIQESGTPEGYKYLDENAAQLLPVMFPSHTPSELNPKAPVLSKEMYSDIQGSLRNEYIIALATVCQYWGLTIVEKDGQKIIQPADNILERAAAIKQIDNREPLFKQVIASLMACGLQEQGLQIAHALVQHSEQYGINPEHIQSFMEELFLREEGLHLAEENARALLNDSELSPQEMSRIPAFVHLEALPACSQEIPNDVNQDVTSALKEKLKRFPNFFQENYSPLKNMWDGKTKLSELSLTSLPFTSTALINLQTVRGDSRLALARYNFAAPRYFCSKEREASLLLERTQRKQFAATPCSPLFVDLNGSSEKPEEVGTKEKVGETAPPPKFQRVLSQNVFDDNFPVTFRRRPLSDKTLPLIRTISWPWTTTSHGQVPNTLLRDFFNGTQTLPGKDLSIWSIFRTAGTPEGDALLEKDRDIARLLLPTKDLSPSNPRAPFLSNKMALSLQSDPQIASEYLFGVIMFLNHWGCTLDENGQFQKTKDFGKRAKQAHKNPDTAKQMLRLVQSLSDAGYGNWAHQALDFFIQNQTDYGLLENKKSGQLSSHITRAQNYLKTQYKQQHLSSRESEHDWIYANGSHPERSPIPQWLSTKKTDSSERDPIFAAETPLLVWNSSREKWDMPQLFAPKLFCTVKQQHTYEKEAKQWKSALQRPEHAGTLFSKEKQKSYEALSIEADARLSEQKKISPHVEDSQKPRSLFNWLFKSKAPTAQTKQPEAEPPTAKVGTPAPEAEPSTAKVDTPATKVTPNTTSQKSQGFFTWLFHKIIPSKPPAQKSPLDLKDPRVMTSEQFASTLSQQVAMNNFPVLCNTNQRNTGETQIIRTKIWTTQKLPPQEKQKSTSVWLVNFFLGLVTIPNSEHSLWEIFSKAGTPEGDQLLDADPDIASALLPTKEGSANNADIPAMSKEMVQLVQTSHVIASKFIFGALMLLKNKGCELNRQGQLQKTSNFAHCAAKVKNNPQLAQQLICLVKSLSDAGYNNLAYQTFHFITINKAEYGLVSSTGEDLPELSAARDYLENQPCCSVDAPLQLKSWTHQNQTGLSTDLLEQFQTDGWSRTKKPPLWFSTRLAQPGEQDPLFQSGGLLQWNNTAQKWELPYLSFPKEIQFLEEGKREEQSPDE